MDVAELTHESNSTAERAAWPYTFKFGEFVRLVYHPELWGLIVGPCDHPGRWIFEYPQGARVTNSTEAFEVFVPTIAQRRRMERRVAELAANGIAAVWPDRAA